jgi:predicted transcriptional regulator
MYLGRVDAPRSLRFIRFTHTPSRVVPRPPLPMNTNSESFLDALAGFAAEDGLPRGAGRMLGWLLLQEKPSSLDEVALALGISKSAASDYARLLARLGAVELRQIKGDRRDYYDANASLCDRLLERFVARIEQLGRCLADGAVTAATPTVDRRFARLVERNAHIVDELRMSVARLRERPLAQGH